MGLREMTENAAIAVDCFKKPEIFEWIVAINPILQASGLYSIHVGDKVDSIEIGENLVIGMKPYELRIPMRIIDADDSIKAAKEWRLRREYADVDREITMKYREISRLESKRDNLLININSL